MLKQKTTPLQMIDHPLFREKNLQVFVKREELNHPKIQGNKLYKLELNLTHFFKSDKKFLLTFGGAYSNHIAATAAAANQFQIPAIGIIRGAELAGQKHKWSHTLLEAQQNGMQLVFINRRDYRLKYQTDFLSLLQQNYADQLPDYFAQQKAYLLPEGGSNQLAVQGFTSLAKELENQCPGWNELYCAVGTGATLAGLTAYSEYSPERVLKGVAALKESDYLVPQIKQWINAAADKRQINRWQLLGDCHCGGYAKSSQELETFLQEVWSEFQIPLDPIYTSKTFFCFWKSILNQEIKPNSRVILLHTGGLQGGQV